MLFQEKGIAIKPHFQENNNVAMHDVSRRNHCCLDRRSNLFDPVVVKYDLLLYIVVSS